MRKSFFTLRALVRQHIEADLLSGADFVFIKRRATHLKLLTWESDGWSIYYKGLEQGTFEHPTTGM